MRHHAQNVAAGAADSGNILKGPVGIRFGGDFSFRVAIAENDSPVAAQLGQRRIVADIIAVHMSDGNAKDVALARCVGEGRFGILDANMHRLANVFQSRVAHQGARQQASLAKNLKAVADSQHQSAAIGEFLDRFHHR